MIKRGVSFIFLNFFLLLGTKAAELNLIPNSKTAANKNAEVLVNMINSGKEIVIDDLYYIGSSKKRIHKDLIIKGSGTLITTVGNNLFVDTPISIIISNITLKTTRLISAGTQNRFIVNEGVNYHRCLVVKNCTIDGVRVYTHIASDVDQVDVKDGVKNVTFTGNKVSNIGDYVLLMTNCGSDKVNIENNNITRMYVMGFGLGVDNDYKELGYARMKKVYFRNNNVDNTGLIISDADNFGSTYMTPILCEADYCLCENNIIKNILATIHKPIALYPFYLSCREVVIRNNDIQNCLHLADSRYNEMFKCKGGPGGLKHRLVERNKYTITSDCLRLCPTNAGMPIVRMTGFQSTWMGNVIIRNNDIDIACDFVFGAGAMCCYRSYLFENNRIKYHDVGKSAQQLLRLKPAEGNGSKISVKKNTMSPMIEATDVFGLFLGDCTGYSFEITNNQLSGCLPTGEDDIDPSRPLFFKSIGNRVNLGKSHSVVRISRDVSCDDTFTGGDNYTMYVYPSDIMQGSLIFHFEGTAPVNVMAFTQLPNKGSCEVIAKDEYGSRKYSCGLDDTRMYIKSHDDGIMKTIKKGEKIAKIYVGEFKNNIGRLISDGKMIYYSSPSSYKGNLTLQLKYNAVSNIVPAR